MSQERRKKPRHNVNLIVEITSRSGTENYHLGMTKNISAEGFTFESQNYNILQGQVLELDIKLPDSNLSVSAVGKGVWVKITDFECLTGIEFLGLDEEARNRIEQLFSSPTPEPGIDMHHDYIPEAYSSKIDTAIFEAVSRLSNTDAPGNDEPSIPEYSNIADHEQAVPTDENIEMPAATTEAKDNIQLDSKRYENRRKEPPLNSVRPVKSRTAAEVSSRKKRSYLPLAVISVVIVIAVASVFGVMKWKSNAPAPDSSQTALNETEDAIIHKELWQIGTPSVQDNVEDKDIAGDLPGKEQPVIRAASEHDNALNGTELPRKPANEIALGKNIVSDMSDKKLPVLNAAAKDDTMLNEIALPWERVPINDSSKPPSEPELDTTVTIKNEAPPESSAVSIAKIPAVKKDSPAAKETVAARKEVDNIPRNGKPGRIIIPSTYRRLAYLENIRRKIQQEAKKTQTPVAITEPAPVIKLPETTKPVADKTNSAKAIPSDKINHSAIDKSLAGEPGPRIKTMNTIDQAHIQIVSEPVSSSAAPPTTQIRKDIPEKQQILPLEEEKQVPSLSAVALKVSPRNIEDNTSKELISSSTAKKTKSYDEPFDHNTNDWDTFNTRSAFAQIHNGAYIIENKRKEGAHLLFHQYDFPAASDFIMETSIRLLENSATASFGLIFGAKDPLNNHAFQITTNRLYKVRNYHQGVSREITMGEKGAAAINIYALNKLKIIRSGNNMSFYINDKFIGKITDLNLYGKKFGFIIDGQSKIAVEHIHSEVQVAN